MNKPMSAATVVSITFLISVTAFTVDSAVPILPLVADALGASDQLAQLIVGLFILGYALGQIPCGLLLDRFGRRPVMFGALSVFVLAGIWGSMTDSIYQLLAARFFQGMAGAIGPVGSRTIIRDIATDKQLPALMATSMTALSVVTMIAPVIGSTLAMFSNWRAPFWASVALGVATIVLVWRYIPTIVLNETQHKNVWVQLRFSLRIYTASRQSTWSAALLAVFFAGYLAMVAGGSTVIVDYYGMSPLWSGYLYTFSALTYVIGSLVNRRLMARYSMLFALRFSMLCLVFTLLGFVWISLSEHVSLVWLWGVASAYTFVLGFVLPNTNSIALGPITQAKGFASSITGTTQIFGGAVGAIACAQFYDGTFHTMVIILALASCTALLIYAARNRWVEAFVM